MAITQDNQITASDVNSLKTRIETEATRRSISYTAGTTTAGNTATAVWINTLITPLNSINDTLTSFSTVSQGDSILPVTIDAPLVTFEGSPKEGTNSNCKSGCTGLCQGCTGSCQGTCTGSCQGGCTNKCTNNCTGCTGCTNTCTNACKGCTGCTNTCTNACKGCKGCSSCTNACRGSCDGYCSWSSPCTGNCSSGSCNACK